MNMPRWVWAIIWIVVLLVLLVVLKVNLSIGAGGLHVTQGLVH